MTYGQLKRSRASQQSVERAARSHSVVCEERRMRSLRPDEIVASVMRWSHDYIVCDKRFERVFENRTRQVWAVAVEGNGASMVNSWEVCEHRREACGKTFTCLRNYARLVTCQPR